MDALYSREVGPSYVPAFAARLVLAIAKGVQREQVQFVQPRRPLVRHGDPDIGLAQQPGRRADARQHGSGHSKNSQQLLIPIERLQVAEECSTGITHISDVRSPPGA